MNLPSILLGAIVFLSATAVCVLLFQRLGLGSILGFIVAGVIIGPYTPGPVPLHAVDELQSIAELGVVLFMFTVGLEMRPEKVWAMRRLIFGLGSAQMLVTAAVFTAYMVFLVHIAWESAVILGLAFAMSSTAIVMATLGERGELATEHGRTTFAVLMAQDLWVVPVMALVPILGHVTAGSDGVPVWRKSAEVIGVLAAILVVGRYVLPTALGYCAGRRQMEAFQLVLFLAVIAAAWAVEAVGISMTLGAFLLGMLLSASDLRFQIEASIAPFKQTLMGLFFIAVGMSIDVGAFRDDWQALLVHVPAVLAIKVGVLATLVLAFGIRRGAAVKTAFYLSQVGEFAFVLLGAATVSGLLTPAGHTLAMLVVAASMIASPMMVKAGGWIAARLGDRPAVSEGSPGQDLDRHVIVIGFDEVGQLIDLMLEKAGVQRIAIDRDIDNVRTGKRAGRSVYYGDMFSATTQEAVGLAKAAAVFVTSRDVVRAKALAVTLHQLYPNLDIYVRLPTIADRDELVAKGIRHAATGYIESTLARGAVLLADFGVPETDVAELLQALRKDDYAQIRSAFVSEEPAAG